jgi:hypothetical protein
MIIFDRTYIENYLFNVLGIASQNIRAINPFGDQEYFIAGFTGSYTVDYSTKNVLFFAGYTVSSNSNSQPAGLILRNIKIDSATEIFRITPTTTGVPMYYSVFDYYSFFKNSTTGTPSFFMNGYKVSWD